jgi:hypothetical protein
MGGNKVKIGFMWPRTNVVSEQQNIFNGSLRIQSELQNIDAYTIKKTFERIMKRKPVKKVKLLNKATIMKENFQMQIKYNGR